METVSIAVGVVLECAGATFNQHFGRHFEVYLGAQDISAAEEDYS